MYGSVANIAQEHRHTLGHPDETECSAKRPCAYCVCCFWQRLTEPILYLILSCVYLLWLYVCLLAILAETLADTHKLS